MSKVLTIIAVAVFVIFAVMYFAFRGEVVETLPATVGRIKTKDGFSKTLISPGTVFRLPSNWFGQNPSRLVTVEVSDNQVLEPIDELYMPQDRLNLKFGICAIMAVRDDDKSIDFIFDRLAPSKTSNKYVERISFREVYIAYGQEVLRTKGQQVVAGFSIEDVLKDLNKASAAIQTEVNKRLEGTPIVCKYAGLGKVEPPELIVKAQEDAKKREVEQITAEAQKEVSLTKADADYQVKLIEQQIELVQAETQVLSDLILSDAVSEAYVAQRALRVLEKQAKNPNTRWLLPTRVFADPKTLLGLSDTSVSRMKTDAATQQQLKAVLQDIEKIKQETLEQMRKEAAAAAVQQAMNKAESEGGTAAGSK